MLATETVPAGTVADLPAGTLVEVKGTLRCAAPVTGHLSQSPCAHYVATVLREYSYYRSDSNGRRQRVRGNETLESVTACAAFEVVDDSGAVLVRPEEATVEGISAVERYEPYEGGSEGGFAVAAINALTRNEQTHGFRYSEVQLPLDAPIYVLGVTGDGAIGAKPKRGQSFVISTKSEEMRAADLARGGKWMLGIGIACLIALAVCLALALWVA
ncbi:E3 Ubiquitin ligase [Methyloligella halotolerans]|uniref:RING-type E3 ubiquitin transferase n=1 Tax=Methyloligella halotolerans TaxID=1177755 RepID=A0A1E2RYE8_9HYPH|nr:GIDE domain-containing protein [Methyloligella halotolerans]ODA67128.1 E3 Ubiquitin ligase [Methyloligella halotolerans]